MTHHASHHAFRTSQTDPLQIAELRVGGAGGIVGITLCPGKQGDSVYGRPWKRDLAADLAAIAAWGACAVVTLIEDHEFEMLGVPSLGRAVTAAGMTWHHLPITDVRPPDARFETLWRATGPALHGELRAGRRFVVHCRGGLGRAGTVAARLLIETGVAAGDAVNRVRAVRKGAIETSGQEAYLMGLTQSAGNSP